MRGPLGGQQRESEMTTITVNGESWVSADHFYYALLTALGAPESGTVATLTPWKLCETEISML